MVTRTEERTSARCRDCGEYFIRKGSESWKKLCFACWREQQRDDSYQTGFAAGFNSGKYEGIRETWERTSGTQADGSETADFMKGYLAGLAAGRRETKTGIDAQRIRELLQLSHPDRHGGSPLATRVTRWLLELRRGEAR